MTVFDCNSSPPVEASGCGMICVERENRVRIDAVIAEMNKLSTSILYILMRRNRDRSADVLELDWSLLVC